ncbi:MAG TPA: GNAT family N-acetyltransferase [Gemmatimonadales bacterium]|nr:GNAT family N-acetyltransferase [Gemmatimonadales bacterium]
MRAWLPERHVVGPERPGDADIEPLNRVFADAFTDRYRRDGLVGVRVPQLNPEVWRYALLDAGDGAMIWRDEAGQVAAFNIAHRSGSEGWMGPLAVRPDRQGAGTGKLIVQAAVDWLIARGASTIGLETMPRTVENIGFYARLGFLPGHLTVTMTRDIGARGHPLPALLSQRGRDAHQAAALAASRLVTELVPGPDFTREILLTAELALGDTTLVDGPNGLDAVVLWHSVPLAEGRPRDELRVLKLAARDEQALVAALAATEGAAAGAGIRRVAVRCQTRSAGAFRVLVERGYRVRWTDLRMTLEGYPEPEPRDGVVFSNWEI